jgi:hypothetical protein
MAYTTDHYSNAETIKLRPEGQIIRDPPRSDVIKRLGIRYSGCPSSQDEASKALMPGQSEAQIPSRVLCESVQSLKTNQGVELFQCASDTFNVLSSFLPQIELSSPPLPVQTAA